MLNCETNYYWLIYKPVLLTLKRFIILFLRLTNQKKKLSIDNLEKIGRWNIRSLSYSIVESGGNPWSIGMPRCVLPEKNRHEKVHVSQCTFNVIKENQKENRIDW